MYFNDVHGVKQNQNLKKNQQYANNFFYQKFQICQNAKTLGNVKMLQNQLSFKKKHCLIGNFIGQKIRKTEVIILFRAHFLVYRHKFGDCFFVNP